ncbi:hypothetical protein FJ417_32870 [Mesorhizobium sp. B3-1-7]|uniref:hypothetical protein n=1 Tax=Mesorhizobium sp. B3-1-7 TaxID=2589894 RepID=UPI00112D79FB|nr:hypothetical protein [Mesorhizobium sp. B3-1-7]TPI44812.1 hypothetical protein FJ417_32870 [Mesorhizobium sp. B3-1-7]
MKTPSWWPIGIKNADPLKNFTPEQLQLIGSVAMLYNECEYSLHMLASGCFTYYPTPFSITKRINGTEGLIEIFILSREATVSETKHPGLKGMFLMTLKHDGFSRAKSWRDAVVHTRNFDFKANIGRTIGRQAKADDTLLTKEALGWLVSYLSALEREMDALVGLCQAIDSTRKGASQSDQHKARTAKLLQQFDQEYRSRQTLRLALLPAPKFPDQWPGIRILKDVLSEVFEDQTPKE